MKTFKLYRKKDISGVSGTGWVAEGVEFSNGRVVISWLGELSSTNVYQSMDDAKTIHGHEGNTLFVFETINGSSFKAFQDEM
jgi:hypothetical protein